MWTVSGFSGQAQKMKYTPELNIAKEQDKWLLERNQKKDSSYQRKLQKKIQSVAEGNAELCIEFPEMSESHINITQAILANPEVIDGLYFEHLWFVNEENVFYQGKIVAVKLSKNCKVYKVAATYWKRGSSQEDGFYMNS
ncbi:hypothetical protein EMCRGX_G016322 [Ephydatia muelleri]